MGNSVLRNLQKFRAISLSFVYITSSSLKKTNSIFKIFYFSVIFKGITKNCILSRSRSRKEQHHFCGAGAATCCGSSFSLNLMFNIQYKNYQQCNTLSQVLLFLFELQPFTVNQKEIRRKNYIILYWF
jgi:hypothetical protein